MPYTMEEFIRDFTAKHREQFIAALTTEERLEGLPVEEIERYLQHRRAAEASSAAAKKTARTRRKTPRR
jgi:hypothetical protein